MAYEELKQKQAVMWGNGPYQKTARERAGDHGLDIDYRVGDSERLEPEDASFETRR